MFQRDIKYNETFMLFHGTKDNENEPKT